MLGLREGARYITSKLALMSEHQDRYLRDGWVRAAHGAIAFDLRAPSDALSIAEAPG